MSGRRRTGARLLAGPSLPPVPAPPDRPVAIDDADAAAELPLLHLLNACAEAGRPLLLAARTPPARWPTGLADLASRLRALTIAEIRAPDDGLLRALLARLLAERQLAVTEPVQDWLRLRLPRTPAAMREAAARLDRTALVAGRRVTPGGRRRRACARCVPAAPMHEDLAKSPAASAGASCLL